LFFRQRVKRKTVTNYVKKGGAMAKYGKKAQEKVHDVMEEYEKGKLKSGPKGKGGKVTSRKQAVAIGLSEARKKGAKVPKKK